MIATSMPLLLALMTQTFHLPSGLLSAVCYVESGHNTKAIHRDDGGGNSVGVCQVKLATARMLGFKGNEKDLQVPETNIFYSARYLSRNLVRYGGNISAAVAAYNSGRARIVNGHFRNQRYVTKVFKAWSKGL